MRGRRLLVVATAPVDDEVLRQRVREHAGGEQPEVRIVGAASDLSPLQWLTNDEGAAREEAAEVARSAERAVASEAAATETDVGDSDPVQAIEDALRQFPADEVLVVTRQGDDAGWLEEDAAETASQRFGVPVRQIVV